jgi:hypothetical protein
VVLDSNPLSSLACNLAKLAELHWGQEGTINLTGSPLSSSEMWPTIGASCDVPMARPNSTSQMSDRGSSWLRLTGQVYIICIEAYVRQCQLEEPHASTVLDRASSGSTKAF